MRSFAVIAEETLGLETTNKLKNAKVRFEIEILYQKYQSNAAYYSKHSSREDSIYQKYNVSGDCVRGSNFSTFDG